MTEADAQAAVIRAQNLLDWLKYLKKARQQLELVNKHAAKNQPWRVNLQLSKDLPYGFQEVEYVIPFAHLQQQCIDKVRDAERNVILLGGTP